MKKITSGILAHVDAGKTTLTECFAHLAGITRKQGRVDHGDAYMDTDPFEKERGITIYSKEMVFSYADTKIYLIDTPGHNDFAGEMERALSVLDCAILVISAADGATDYCRMIFALLAERRIPVFIFINKMDQPGHEKAELLAGLREALSPDCAEISDLETIAASEEAAMEEYLANGSLAPDTLRRLIAERAFFPCYFGSALKNEGVEVFLSDLCALSPEITYGEEFGAKVFRISRDERSRRLTHMKLTGGSLQVKDEVAGGKADQIRIYSGKNFEQVSEVRAGEVCAVTGPEHTYPGQGLGTEPDDGTRITPDLVRKIVLPEGTDKLKLLPQLLELNDEDPLLHISRDEVTDEILVTLMGPVQAEVLKHLILDRYGVEVGFDLWEGYPEDDLSCPEEWEEEEEDYRERLDENGIDWSSMVGRPANAQSSDAKERPFLTDKEARAILAKAGGANAAKEGRHGWHVAAARNVAPKTSGEYIYRERRTPEREKYLLIDGYNLIHAWPELSELLEVNLDGARAALNDILCAYQAIRGINLIVVYDAYRVPGPVREEEYQNIRIVFTKEAQTADSYIELFTHEHGKKYDITVVTSDGIEQIITRGAGSRILSSREFREEIGEAKESIRQYLAEE